MSYGQITSYHACVNDKCNRFVRSDRAHCPHCGADQNANIKKREKRRQNKQVTVLFTLAFLGNLIAAAGSAYRGNEQNVFPFLAYSVVWGILAILPDK